MTDSHRWRVFQRRGEVAAERIVDTWTWTTDDGDVMTARPGDWRVSDDAGSVRSVAAEVFDASYEQVGPGRYRRIGMFRARQATHEEVISTGEGNTTAHAGDWVVEGSAGEQWPVPSAKFDATYEEVLGKS
ncbi:hypothetical protein [Gordonia bronchialis]|uniref:hypothetical protein n=1 Tax=Gordonia bronchialis TaxID=2054 RepID=UPI00226FCEF9|nr:hypothetical protein [Gordonia bronchialis]